MTSPTGVSVNKQADGSVVITGKGEAGATITARDADGKSIATTTVGTDGTFTLTLPKSAVTSGDKITVVQQKDGKTSDVLNITVPADQPTGMTVNIDANGNVHVVGKGTPGSTVYIFTADGDSLASGKVGADGNFDILVPTDSSKPGTILAIVQATNGGLSNAIGIKVPAKQPTKVVVDNEAGNITVTGEGTPGATITVTDSEGNKVAQGTVGSDGKFTITVPKGSVKPGDSISVTTTDGGNDSNPIKVTVPSEKPGSMTVTNGDKDVTVTGTGKPGATITITDSNGKEIGKTTVGSDGKFTLTVSKDGLAAGDKLYVTSTDGGVASNPVGITIPAQGTTTDANGDTINAGNGSSTGNGTGTTTGNGSNTGNGTGTTTGNGSNTGNGTGTTTGNGSTNGNGTTAGNGSTTGTNGNGTVAGDAVNGGSNLGKLANDSSKQATSNNGSLPQTNDSVEGSLAVAGTIMLGLVGLLGARRRREDMI
ncbi:Ig-like domain-containing protein [Lactiplantibacillus daoliensis]|uniref:Ig-like domain-containing protein n=1 Tax=Lactiplantibacillus daoliensis TaxID=2559916 RepID=UPI0014852A41|nr:Ig-like domain-containing protein [Lactiplantibacillus daoliensis]